MDGKLLAQALAKFASGVLLVGLLVFLPAGTLDWWRGWLLMAALFAPMFVAGLVMMAKAPDLLRKRLDAREDEDEQKSVLALSAVMFVAAELHLFDSIKPAAHVELITSAHPDPDCLINENLSEEPLDFLDTP